MPAAIGCGFNAPLSHFAIKGVRTLKRAEARGVLAR
jgi:hypothetical protein